MNRAWRRAMSRRVRRDAANLRPAHRAALEDDPYDHWHAHGLPAMGPGATLRRALGGLYWHWLELRTRIRLLRRR